MKMRKFTAILIFLSISILPVRGQEPSSEVRLLRHTTSWVGNSFGGDGGGNGKGYWVQNGADEIEVTPDGTVFAGVSWDEAGRCAGLYKDGRVNCVFLKEHDGEGQETAWGWGTASNAVAVNGEHLYLANTGKKLLRFRWTPGELDSARFIDEVSIGGEAVGLSARGDQIVVIYRDELEIQCAGDMGSIKRFGIPEARDVAIAADGSYWILAGATVHHFSTSGKDLGPSVPGLEQPTAVSFDHQGRLMICGDGPRQQVLTFDVTSQPRLVATFGDQGGLLSGARACARPGSCLGCEERVATRPAISTSLSASVVFRRVRVSSALSSRPENCDGSCCRLHSLTHSDLTRLKTARSFTAGPRSSISIWPDNCRKRSQADGDHGRSCES